MLQVAVGRNIAYVLTTLRRTAQLDQIMKTESVDVPVALGARLCLEASSSCEGRPTRLPVKLSSCQFSSCSECWKCG